MASNWVNLERVLILLQISRKTLDAHTDNAEITDLAKLCYKPFFGKGSQAGKYLSNMEF